MTALTSPRQYQASGVAVLGVVINAIDAAAGFAADTKGLNVTLDAQL